MDQLLAAAAPHPCALLEATSELLQPHLSLSQNPSTLQDTADMAAGGTSGSTLLLTHKANVHINVQVLASRYK